MSDTLHLIPDNSVKQNKERLQMRDAKIIEDRLFAQILTVREDTNMTRVLSAVGLLENEAR